MANLAITEAEVVADSTGKMRTGAAGEEISAGEPVYFDTATNTWKIMSSDAVTTVGALQNGGIAVCAAEVAGQIVTVQIDGTPILGSSATVLAGQTYVASLTAGSIAAEGDIVAGDFVCILGVGDGAHGLIMPKGGPHVGTTAHA